MTFPILGANSAVGGYAIDNSLRFNDNDSARLTRTPSSSSNRKTFSISCWFKRGNISLGDSIDLYSAGQSSGGTGSFSMHILANDSLRLDANAVVVLNTNRLFRDVSAWYHYLLVVDTTQATASNRFKIYINGVEETSFATDNRSSISQNTDLRWNMNEGHGIGFNFFDTTYYYDGYIAEFYNIDGTAKSPTDFGEFDEDSGIWKPIQYTGTYGTNGFYLDFENSGSLGADQSGNGNNFTPTNLASTDQTTDTPTNNFATLNPLSETTLSTTFSEGNLKVSTTATSTEENPSTIAIPTGSFYSEYYIVANGGTPAQVWVGISSPSYSSSNLRAYAGDARYYNGSGWSSYGATFAPTDIIGVAFDSDNNTIEFYKNGVSQGQKTSISASSPSAFFIGIRGASGSTVIANFGQDSSFAGNETRQNNSDDNGYGDFYYAPPSGYLALCTQNLATELSPTIDDGSQYFNTVLYTGTGSSLGVTGVGFQPDWTWIKGRSGATEHVLTDSSRGVTEELNSNDTSAEETVAQGLTAFGTDGFTVGTDGSYNTSSATYASWNWLANGGTTSSNTDGSITATLQSNATSGFAIATWSGTGTAGTIGHGLGVQPKLVIVRRRNAASNWLVQHSDLASNNVLFLNLTAAEQSDSTTFNGTYPTSSVFSVGTHAGTNQSGGTYVGYIFAPITGYSAMGKHTGNITSGTDGTFVYTGFRPSWIMVKSSSNAGQEWVLFDSKRDSFNVATKWLYQNAATAENGTADQRDVDFLSNGFKFRNAGGPTSYSGRTYIYMAFAESPFVTSTGIPVTAR